jgi:hypothetical protein
MRYSIVGQKWRNKDSYLPGIVAGTIAILVREPDNAHDPNAVMVWIDGEHVGYLRKEDAAVIAHRIDWAGEDWCERPVKDVLAADATGDYPTIRKAITVKFARSPNSAYPQVEIPE